MKNFQIALGAAVVLFMAVANAQNTQITKATNNRIEPLPRDLEIQLAFSALPPHLRDDATVYVLNPDKGFEVAHKGTNGFFALVARTGDDTFRGTWSLMQYRDDILYPISFDEAGAKAQMRVFVDAAEMQAKGTPPQELKNMVQQRYRTHYYKAPERAGVSYMLSPILRTYVNPDANEEIATANIPHVMYYAPNVVNSAQMRASTPSTAIPTSRNGSRISQMNGYKINASSARGQQRTKRIHHKRNVSMFASRGTTLSVIGYFADRKLLRQDRNSGHLCHSCACH